MEIKTEKRTRRIKRVSNDNLILKYVYRIKDGDTINNTIIDKLDGAASLRVSPDGSQVYVTNLVDHSLVVFNRKIGSGILEHSATFTDGVSGVDGLNGATSVAASSDGRNVYVTSLGDNSLAVFDRDVASGVLKYSSIFKDGQASEGLGGAYSVVVSPDDKNVYVASNGDNALVVFNRNTHNGALTYSTALEGVGGLTGAAAVAISSDGNNVYVASLSDKAVAVFNRNTSTGALTYSTHISNIDGAIAVEVSDDGKNVYVIGTSINAIVVFNRNTTTGALTYSTEFKNGPGMQNPSSVSESPDGSNVYVTGSHSKALVVFTRNTSTGALTYSKIFENGVGGVDGLDLAASVTVSPDGLNVYVASQGDDAVVIFERKPVDVLKGFQ